MEAFEGTVECRGGQHPYTDGSCLCHIFFQSKTYKYFLERFRGTKNILEKTLTSIEETSSDMISEIFYHDLLLHSNSPKSEKL